MTEPTPRELERRAEDDWLTTQRDLAGLPEYDTSWLRPDYIDGSFNADRNARIAWAVVIFVMVGPVVIALWLR